MHVLAAAGFIERTLGTVPTPVAYLLIFLVPALEASIFLGFVIPGETVIVLGGVLAYQHHVALGGAIALAIAGAIIGDSVGFEIGHRYGELLRQTKLGKVVGDKRWQSADAFLHRRKGPAVFLGRFTALLRALVPAVAGMAHLPYRTFLLWNAIGGITWATTFTLLGYAAGNAYQRVEKLAGRFSLGLLGVIVVGFVVHHFYKSRHEHA